METDNTVKLHILQRDRFNETCRKRSLHIAENCLQQKTFTYSLYLHEGRPAAIGKISVLCCSATGKFRCVSSHILWNYRLDSLKMSNFIAFICDVPIRGPDLKCAPLSFCQIGGNETLTSVICHFLRLVVMESYTKEQGVIVVKNLFQNLLQILLQNSLQNLLQKLLHNLLQN